MRPLRASSLQKLVTPQVSLALRLALGLDPLFREADKTAEIPIASRVASSLLLSHPLHLPAAIKIQTVERFHAELDVALEQGESIARVTQRLTRWIPRATTTQSDQLNFGW